MYADIFNQQFQPCECCKPRYTTSTFTTSKWTKKEVENRLLELSIELAGSKWYNRGRIIDQIKHWSEKLERYNRVVEEFKIKS